MRSRAEARLGPGVVGLDLSLTRPGACFLPTRWQVGDWAPVAVARWQYTDETENWPEGALDRQYDRLDYYADKVCTFVREHAARYAYVEEYAFSKRLQGQRALAELGGVVRRDLYLLGVTLVPVTASAARKVLLGRNPQGKDQKLQTHLKLFGKRCGAPKTWCEDEADAFCIANYGRTELGLPALVLHDGR